MYQDNEVTIRPVEPGDMDILWTLLYEEQEPEWKKWDAPYFPHVHVPYESFIADREKWIGKDERWVITVRDQVIGTVSYYWEHEPSRWLEMGIGIYDPAFWSGGYGTRALRMWISHLFATMPLVRVGYTTWSGNERMMKVGEKLGMTMEGRMRKCRYYDGAYYDSIRMGLLREEAISLGYIDN
ncbi:GNAT family protein [Ectobacillus antri]|jgi:RimJ/RimL family protein N-acetyltransferase|uniref:GNAT family protein n=1 Tax=Ectobacillus antri TaxID=2486280 RepID=A0ABT6H695_9BACI|nr:GNAT family protein [Ectobacillus antri]MDG4657742.1 GNAT family protein [Ectobacillus antri]MDG5754749.1 GNAT family protein [Ectobacillus antri]